MSQSQTVELGPNGQETVTYDAVDDNTDSLLVTMLVDGHDDVSTFLTWVLDGEEFPEGRQTIDEYPARLEPLGDELRLKIRNDSDQGTEVTVGFREKRLAVA